VQGPVQTCHDEVRDVPNGARLAHRFRDLQQDLSRVVLLSKEATVEFREERLPQPQQA
jgi:hypothetical protein